VGISSELMCYYEKIGLIKSINNDINLIKCLGNIVMLCSLDLSLELIGEVREIYEKNLSRTEEFLRAKSEGHQNNLKKTRPRAQ